MNLNENVKASESARAFIEAIKAKACGWDVPVAGRKPLHGELVYFYGYDHLSSLSWMAAASLDAMRAVLRLTVGREEEWGTYRACVGELIGAMSSDPSGDQIPPESPIRLILGKPEHLNAEMLAALIAAYAGTTEVGLDPDGIEPGTHFVAVRYPSSAPGTPIRFFVAGGSKPPSVMPLAEFEAVVNDVSAADFETNPEWFF